MKMPILASKLLSNLIIAFLLIILVCHTELARTQTTLTAGDLAIIGMRTSGGDGTKIVSLVDLTCGTTFIVTDNGWDLVPTPQWVCTTSGTREFACLVTVTGKICAGSVIVISDDGSNNFTVATSSGSASVTDLGNPWGTNSGYNSGGDNSFILAGNSTIAAPTFIFGIKNGAAWADGACNVDISNLPAGLTNGTNALFRGTGTSAWYYNCATALTSGTRAALLASISNSANWTTTGALTTGSCTFTVTGCAPPTPHQPTGFGSSAVTNTTATISWTNCPNTNVIVVARAVNPVATAPTSGTAYTANSAYGSGSAIGAGFVVYIGQGSSVNLTNLTPNTTYHFAIYEFSCTGNCYNTTSPLTGSIGTPLPVELASFQVQCANGQLHSNWSTFSEINNHYFEIQGSHDAVEYFRLGKIMGNGNSNVLQSYTSKLNNISRFNYFRLTQVDYDGTTKNYEPIYLECDYSFPNLTATYHNNEIQLLLPTNISSNSTLTIADLNGKAIISQSLNSHHLGESIFIPFNESISSGIYIISIFDQLDGSSYYAKIFKN